MVRMIRRLSALSSTTAILRIYSNHITLLSHRIGVPFFAPAIQVRAAGLIRPEWVNAYGKFPRASPCRPQVIRLTQHLLESESGYHQPPGSRQAFHKPKRGHAKSSFFANKLSSRQGCPSLTTSAWLSIVEIIRG